MPRNRFSVEAIFKAVDKMTAPVRRMQNRVGKFTRSAERGLRRVNRAADAVAGTLTRGLGVGFRVAAVGAGGLVAIVGLLLGEFSRVEDATAAFTPLMGGVAKATELVDRLNKTAATTPFRFGTLSGAAKQLLPVMNQDIERTISTIRRLGDTAGGNAQKLDSITRGFTKAMLKGKVDMESLNMIAEAGVPIFTELAASMGTKVGPAFFKMISAGKVTTRALEGAFKRMTEKGGIFFKGMEIASQTLTGRISTLKDNISLAAAGIGRVLAPTVKRYVDRAIEAAGAVRTWVSENQDLIRTGFIRFLRIAREELSSFMFTMRGAPSVKDILQGIFDIAVKIVRVIGFIGRHKDVIISITVAIGALVAALKILTAIMTAVNVVMAANPVVLITLGVLALIAAIVLLVKHWDRVKAFLDGIPTWAVILIGALGGPIAMLAAGAELVRRNWKPLKTFFTSLWSGIVSVFTTALDKITTAIARIRSVMAPVAGVAKGIAGALGFGSRSPAATAGAAFVRSTQEQRPQMVSPQERTARTIEETRETSSAEVTIRDETGRAEVTEGALGKGLSLIPTGAF